MQLRMKRHNRKRKQSDDNTDVNSHIVHDRCVVILIECQLIVNILQHLRYEMPSYIKLFLKSYSKHLPDNFFVYEI